MWFFFIQNQSMSLTPHLQGSTSPVSVANDGQSVPGKFHNTYEDAFFFQNVVFACLGSAFF